MQQVHTDSDGTFRLVGYPGRGVVTGWNSNYLRGVGADKIARLKKNQLADPFYPFGFSPQNVNAVVEVNLPEGAESIACELRLKKGKTREVQVVGPDGKPQPSTEASGLTNQIENPMTNVPGDRFSVSNLFPGEARGGRPARLEEVDRRGNRHLRGRRTGRSSAPPGRRLPGAWSTTRAGLAPKLSRSCSTTASSRSTPLAGAGTIGRLSRSNPMAGSGSKASYPAPPTSSRARRRLPDHRRCGYGAYLRASRDA